ncbi:hypothetical protein [Acanthopleuribacter pedis]|uniref:Outer membrane lipoprotein-sorting protein n=1 Tax=Acanthopleuribacter pedis TaxID=442870 RepID=A0A8J7QAT8_9BACT|nr:hypothetical protein [Acanthopleuribacter pedis]MBO1322066.1 hypothetical protein [Acanthopleuribacter pedis]
MKYLMRFGLFCWVALVGAGTVLLAQDLETLIDKNLAARGGAAKLDALTSIRVYGVVKGPSITMDFSYAVADGKIRFEYAMGDKHIMMVLVQNEGWQINPMMGDAKPMRMGAKEAAFLKEMGDIAGPLVAWREKGHQLEHRGKVSLGQGEAYELDLKTAHGHHKSVFLNSDTYLIQRVVEHYSGKKPIFKTTKAYQAVDGVVFPKRVEKRDTNFCTHEDGHAQKGRCAGFSEINYTSIEIAPDLDRSWFRLQHKTTLLADAGH